MNIDPRLNQIDDCLYRVAVRFFAVQDGMVLLVKEQEDEWWALPGGGVDHAETMESAVFREIEEELGVPRDHVESDFRITHYTIGSVVNAVPRMNLFINIGLPKERVQTTSSVIEARWFTKDEFMEADMNSSYNKNELAKVISWT